MKLKKKSNFFIFKFRKKKKITLEDGTIIEISQESGKSDEESINSLEIGEEYHYTYEEVLNEETYEVEMKKVKKKRKIPVKVKDDELDNDYSKKRVRFDDTDIALGNSEIVNKIIYFLGKITRSY